MLHGRKARILAGLAVLVGLAGLLFLPGEPNRDLRGPDWVSARVQEWQLSERERAYEKVHWSHDLVAAQELSRKTGRPLVVMYSEGTLGRS